MVHDEYLYDAVAYGGTGNAVGVHLSISTPNTDTGTLHWASLYVVTIMAVPLSSLVKSTSPGH